MKLNIIITGWYDSRGEWENYIFPGYFPTRVTNGIRIYARH